MAGGVTMWWVGGVMRAYSPLMDDTGGRQVGRGAVDDEETTPTPAPTMGSVIMGEEQPPPLPRLLSTWDPVGADTGGGGQVRGLVESKRWGRKCVD